MEIKMKAGKLARLLNEGFSLTEIHALQAEVRKLGLAEKKYLNS